MQLKTGARLRSAVCTTEVIVVRVGDTDVDLRCGGSPMRPIAEAPDANATPHPALAGGTAVGKRLADEAVGLELLVTKAGAGTLSIGDQPIAVKDAKPLPASD